MSNQSPRFPHPAYARYVLCPAYRGATQHLFAPMLAANRAHAIMLTAQGIISQANGRALLNAIAEVEAGGIEALPYQSGIEDLFFLVEGRIIETCGPEFGGNLQLARSRNDLGRALTRLALRPQLAAMYERLLNLRHSILKLARDHIDTVMPGYTHTQPAQPTTFAHYLAGVLSFLERDNGRIQQAYRITNQSPLGAAAFTGTGFPISREMSAELLGFAGVMHSTHDSIGASDYQTDIASALTSIGINLSRMTHDLLFRATRESGAIRIDDSFIQISSIMPQKRNPVALEHLRARLSRLIGMSQTIVTQCHNIPYGDTQDIEDEIEPTLFGAIETADDILHLYKTVFDTLTLDVKHLKAEAAAGFTTATELADILVREVALPFRTAHHIVSQLVQRALDEKLAPTDLSPALLTEVSASVLGQPLDLPDDLMTRALDPVRFVQARQTLGGSAPQATTAVLDQQSERLANDASWLQEENERLDQAEGLLKQKAGDLLGWDPSC